MVIRHGRTAPPLQRLLQWPSIKWRKSYSVSPYVTGSATPGFNNKLKRYNREHKKRQRWVGDVSHLRDNKWTIPAIKWQHGATI